MQDSLKCDGYAVDVYMDIWADNRSTGAVFWIHLCSNIYSLLPQQAHETLQNTTASFSASCGFGWCLAKGWGIWDQRHMTSLMTQAVYLFLPLTVYNTSRHCK